ncbi:unnamed protein product [Eruca vesicaria subsp. sativa]|uniref:starch synthase n=1 Tax=Eruca vesicaria subsp. sativa TaxID=29727 RepID=A0ABC8IRU7_ERUVS|nr:unnamed protein product [Eruca vesicaria subsp. sativa]
MAPDVTNKILGKVIENCKKHVDATGSKTEVVDGGTKSVDFFGDVYGIKTTYNDEIQAVLWHVRGEAAKRGSMRVKMEKTARLKAEIKERTLQKFLLSQKDVVYTEPLEIQDGRPVTVFYNPSNTVLNGKPEVWFRGSFNRWTHCLGPLPPQKMEAADDGSSHVKTSVVGGIAKEPPLDIVHIVVEVAPIAKVGGLGDVMSIKAIGMAIKLTMEGVSQIRYPQTWFFLIVVVSCVVTQLIYLNKDWSGQDAASVASEICGFITVLTGTMILHGTKEEEQKASSCNADLIFGSSESVRWYESRKSTNEEHLISLYCPEY